MMLILTCSLVYGRETLKAEYDSSTKGIIVYDGNGTQIAKVSVPGGRINYEIAGNKSYIYVNVCFEKDDSFQNYLYRYKRKTGGISARN